MHRPTPTQWLALCAVGLLARGAPSAIALAGVALRPVAVAVAAKSGSVPVAAPRVSADTVGALRAGTEALRAEAMSFRAGETQVAFSATERWVFFSAEDGSERTLVDLHAGTSLALREPLDQSEGSAVGTLVSADEGDEEALRGTAPLLDPSEQRVLHQGAEGLRVVNLASGRREYEWTGTAVQGADFDRDGTRVDWSELRSEGEPGRVHALWLATGVHRSYAPGLAAGGMELSHQGDVLSWIASDGSVRVAQPEREGEGDTYAWPGHRAAAYALSPGGRALAVVYEGRGLAVFRAGQRAPYLRYELIETGATVWDEGGRTLAWDERHSDEASTGDEVAPAVFHVLDVESGRDLRIVGQGRCPLAPETIDRLRVGVLVTNSECSPGCPSIAYSAERNVYSATTGAFLRAMVEQSSPSGHELQAALHARVSAAVRRLGGRLPALVSPEEERVVLRRRGALWAAPMGSRGAPVELAQSAAQQLENLGSSYDGEVLAGVDAEGVARVWSGLTGRVLWSSAR